MFISNLIKVEKKQNKVILSMWRFFTIEKGDIQPWGIVRQWYLKKWEKTEK